MEEIQKAYDTDRARIIAALEYFDGQGWIALQSKRAIEIFEIQTRDFASLDLSDKLHSLFEAKERHEIDRIHDMIRFFESHSCISKKLAEYFAIGVQVVWIADPKHQQVFVYRSLTEIEQFTADYELPGEPVLPGFKAVVSEFF